MKRFFVLAAMLGLMLPFSLGCEKKPEAKPAAPADTATTPPAETPPADAPK